MTFQIQMNIGDIDPRAKSSSSHSLPRRAFDVSADKRILLDLCSRAKRLLHTAFQAGAGMDASSSSPDIPQQYLCPISLQIMTGPVFCIHGEEAAAADHLPANTSVYNFESIYDWLKRGGLYDPLTGTKFEDVITLRPNLSLQREIQEWCSQNNVEYTPRVWRRQEAEASSGNEDTKTWTVGGVLKAVGKFLFTQHPHPYDAYHYAVCA